ncbi:MAG: hypothetical protein Q7J47_03300 [Azoarcus sp.]|nr:hypothetical protein [Azoarcus sp.]
MEFRLVEFNDRRYARGADAARVAAIEDGEEVWLWMSKRDIEKNMTAFGRHPELVKALEAYGHNAGNEAREASRSIEVLGNGGK